MRGRSYNSYDSPSPPPRRKHNPRSPKTRRRRYRGRDLLNSLLVRSLRLDCREPHGFGFVQFLDAAEAKYHMDGQTFLGRELTVVFAEENRKKPAVMRHKDGVRSQSYDWRSSSRYARSFSRSPGQYSTSSRRGHYSRSISPGERRYRERSNSTSPYYSRYSERSCSRSPSRGRSAYRGRRSSYSRSPYRSPSPVRGCSVSSEDY